MLHPKFTHTHTHKHIHIHMIYTHAARRALFSDTRAPPAGARKCFTSSTHTNTHTHKYIHRLQGGSCPQTPELPQQVHDHLRLRKRFQMLLWMKIAGARRSPGCRSRKGKKWRRKWLRRCVRVLGCVSRVCACVCLSIAEERGQGEENGCAGVRCVCVFI